MAPNVEMIRRVADLIEQYPELYTQCSLGVTTQHTYFAGRGMRDNEPSCVAGIAVQYFGNPVELQKSDIPTHQIDEGEFHRRILAPAERYAMNLLGLPLEWAFAIFTINWPIQWFLEEVDELKPFPNGGGEVGTHPDNPWIVPTASQGAFFLRRLADQFEDKTREENVCE